MNVLFVFIIIITIIIIKVFLKRKILSLETILSARARTHTHTHRGTRTHKHSDYKSSKRPGDLEWIRRTEQKTWQVYSFGKRNVFRLDLNESREGFCPERVFINT